MSHLMTKPTKWLCAQRRLRSAWAFPQSDQSLCYALYRKLKTQGFFTADSEDSDDWMDAQADPSLRCAHRSFCWFCPAPAQISTSWLLVRDRHQNTHGDSKTYSTTINSLPQIRMYNENEFPHTEKIYKSIHVTEKSNSSCNKNILKTWQRLGAISQWLNNIEYKNMKTLQYMSHLMTKQTKWLCSQQRLRSAWASAQSDQSLRCLLNG